MEEGLAARGIEVALPGYRKAGIKEEAGKKFEVFEKYCVQNDLRIVMKRNVPMDTNALGEYALNSLPIIRQIFFQSSFREPQGLVQIL